MRALVCGVAKKAIFVLTFSEGISIGRAGGKGTAGTAMAVPVFEGEKMASLGF